MHLFARLTPIALFAALTQSAFAVDLGGLQTFGAVDLAADAGFENPPPATGRVKVRGFEVAISGPVDPVFDALITLAGHDEDGSTELELHEAIVSSTRLLPGFRFRAGRFLLGLGRLNQFHSHDWPFTLPPKMQSLFLSEESVIDSGLEVGYMPPIDGPPVDLVIGMTSGWNYGHSHESPQRPLTPIHYLHPTVFFEGETAGVGTLLGCNYLGRTDADGVRLQLSGLDLTHKRRTGKRLDFLFQSEIFHRLRASSDLPNSEDVAGYIYSEWAIGDSGLSAGLRADIYRDLALTTADGQFRRNLDFGVVPTVTYRASEFSRIQLSYSFQTETKDADRDRREQVVTLQLVSVFGAHPAHDF